MTSQLGFYDYEQFADAVQRLKRDLHLRTNLTDLHINEEKKEELIRLSHHANLKNNPVEVTDEDLRRLYDGLCDWNIDRNMKNRYNRIKTDKTYRINRK